MKIVLHLELDEEELSLSEEDLAEMTESEKEFELSVAMNDYINQIDDWSQAWEYKES